MRILLATDGSKYSSAAVEECCRWFAGGENPAIRIISVIEPPTPIPIEPFAVSGEYYAEAQTALSEQAKGAVERAEKLIVERFTAANLDVETAVVTGNPTKAIVEEAKRYGADLIILGSHGYGFWERILLGSVSNAVAHHAPCSVLLVRDTGE